MGTHALPRSLTAYMNLPTLNSSGFWKNSEMQNSEKDTFPETIENPKHQTLSLLHCSSKLCFEKKPHKINIVPEMTSTTS